MEKTLKWGVLGYAKIARERVIPAIIKASNAELYAIASRDEEKLKQCKETFNCPKYYNSYDKLLDDPEIDAVYIPLINSMHKEWTIKAAEKGKHILCEKPIALTHADFREMRDACSKNGVMLMEAFMYRYTEKTKKVNELIKSGAIGDIRYISASYRSPLLNLSSPKYNAVLGGGAFFDVGCYTVNFVSMIAGDYPVSMSAECLWENDVEVALSGVMTFKNGIIGNVNCGFNAYKRVYCEVGGTKGVIEVPDTFIGEEGTITLVVNDIRQEIKIPESERYVLEVEDFSDAIINNRPTMLDLDESERNIYIIETLYNTAVERAKKAKQ